MAKEHDSKKVNLPNPAQYSTLLPNRNAANACMDCLEGQIVHEDSIKNKKI